MSKCLTKPIEAFLEIFLEKIMGMLARGSGRGTLKDVLTILKKKEIYGRFLRSIPTGTEEIFRKLLESKLDYSKGTSEN